MGDPAKDRPSSLSGKPVADGNIQRRRRRRRRSFATVSTARTTAPRSRAGCPAGWPSRYGAYTESGSPSRWLTNGHACSTCSRLHNASRAVPGAASLPPFWQVVERAAPRRDHPVGSIIENGPEGWRAASHHHLATKRQPAVAIASPQSGYAFRICLSCCAQTLSGAELWLVLAIAIAPEYAATTKVASASASNCPSRPAA
jgi:hypothetical protein